MASKNLRGTSLFPLVLLALTAFTCLTWASDDPKAPGITVDFYEMLNVPRGATKKDIRRAFKKIALEKHPDKNKDNPEAHDIFVQINRAYSVLIDDAKRDIYDRLGHDGLQEHEKSGDQQAGTPHYESWTFYQQSFGLYDDDPNVVTLSQAEFERNCGPRTGYHHHDQPADSDAPGPFDPVWFVDFYSAHCSHCHDLAPHWKSAAQALRGVINVGAVNCLEEWHLCASQSLAAYPTLKLFPQGQAYAPPDHRWDVDDLVTFALTRVPAHYVLLLSSPGAHDAADDITDDVTNDVDVGSHHDRALLKGVVEALSDVRSDDRSSYYTFEWLQASLASLRPWIVIFCHTELGMDDSECPSDLSTRRMARQLFGVVDVLLYRCRSRDHVSCLSHGVKIMYYPKGLATPGEPGTPGSESGDRPFDIFSTLPPQPVDHSSPDTSILTWETMVAVTEALWKQVPDFPLIGVREMEELFSGYTFRDEPNSVEFVGSRSPVAELPHLVVLLLDPLSADRGGPGSESHIDDDTVRLLSQVKRISSPLLASNDVAAISYFDCYHNVDHARYCTDVIGVTKAPSTTHRHGSDAGDGHKIGLVFVKDGRWDGSCLNSSAYEIYHGPLVDGKDEPTLLLPEIVTFVRQSAASRTISLKPSDLLAAQRTIATQGNSLESKVVAHWVVDFFAPWCPPCLRLLPELRKASGLFEAHDLTNAGHDPLLTTLNFGTIDCVEHKAFCTDVVSIKSFPSLHWYSIRADSTYPLQPIYASDGFQNTEAIVDFVMEGLLPSPVQVLTPHSFDDTDNGGDGPLSGKTIWFVDFGARWCGPCNQLEPVWRKFSKIVTGWAKVGILDCGEYKEFCRSLGVRTFPRVRAYVNAQKINDYPDHWWRDLNSIKTWALQFMPSKVEIMDAKAIQSRVLHSRKAWIIDYYANWCGHCTIFAPEFDKLHLRMGDVLSFGKMDCANQRQFCQDQKVPHYPTVRLYLGMGMYEDLDGLTAEELEPEVRGLLANVKEENEREVKDEL